MPKTLCQMSRTRFEDHESAMSAAAPDAERLRCAKCGLLALKKKRLCKPKKVRQFEQAVA